MVPFKPQLEVSENCAFLLFKDWETVLFYTSALNGTMSCDVIKGNNSIAKNLAYGLCLLKHWTDDSMGMRNTLTAPRLVVKYNLHMPAVNRANRACAMCSVQRKEHGRNMAFFTFCLNLSVLNVAIVH